MRDTEQGAQFEALADQFARELRAGKEPKLEEYARLHPEFEEPICRLFPVLQLMEQRGERVDDLSESGLMAEELKQLAALPPLKQLGDYRIIREIGRGGMGIVYEAEQESLGRHVALKVLPDTSQFDERRRQRFQQESKASAMLHHTNIVPVFGVGRNEQISYFVMQYIDGQPLDAVIHELSVSFGRKSTIPNELTDEAQAAISTVANALLNQQDPPQPNWESSLTADSSVANLSAANYSAANSSAEDVSAAKSALANATKAKSEHTDKRNGSNSGTSAFGEDRSSAYWRNVARVGSQVASALAHAHSHGILHRDIKPSNLLLDDNRSVWVTDFGLAKYLDSPDLTRTGEFVGTLRYMSPEQLSGQADERSDIFGLGLTLYEMAALQPGYDSTDRNELLKQVSETSIRPLRTVDRQIPRDLCTIITKCIAHTPSQRYASADLVEADLDRFLAGEPILARRTGTLERTFKWCQRRPAVAALLAALTISLIGGFAGIAWQWQKTADALVLATDSLAESNRQTEVARKHFLQARESVNKFFVIVGQQRLLREPGMQPLRKELLGEALNYHKQFIAQYSDDDELKAELGASLYYIAEIEGQMSASREQYLACDEPIRIFTELVESDAVEPKYKVWLARSLGLKSRFLRRYDAKKSLAALSESIEVLESLREDSPGLLVGAAELAKQYQELGLAHESIGRATQETAKSFEYYSKAKLLRQELQLEFPDDVNQSIMLADLNRDLAITYRRMGEYDRAVEMYEEAVELLNGIVTEFPDEMMATRTLGSVSNSMGFLFGSGSPVRDYDRALECYETSRLQYQTLADQNPLVIEYQDGVARASLNCAAVYQAKGKLDLALASRLSAETVRKRLVDLNPDAVYLRSSWAVSLNGTGSTLRDLDRYDESIAKHKLAHEQHSIAVATDPEQAVLRLRMIDGLVQQARTYSATANYVEAVAVVDSIVEHSKPDFTKPLFQMGREYTLIACKIGAIDAGVLTDEQAALRLTCIDKAKAAFSDAASQGHNVVRSSSIDDTIRSFSQFPECSEMMSWLEQQFGSQ